MNKFQKKPLVYIASPYTQGDKELNVRAHVRMYELMMDEKVVTPIAPLLAHYVQSRLKRTWDQWMEHDLELIAHCQAMLAIDAMVYTPKPSNLLVYAQRESKGRAQEMEFATQLGIPIFSDRAELYKLCPSY